jgi:FkbM family methyltransferase
VTPEWRRITVRSSRGGWSFRAPRFFYEDYYPDVVDEIDEARMEYAALRRLFWDHYDATRTYVDVGAHVGLATLGLAVDGVRCACFEPLDSNLALLRGALDDNGVADRVAVLPVALGMRAERVPMFVPARADNASLDSVVAVANQASQYVVPVSVTVIAFDEVVLDKSRVSLVKIDVQGFELEVLRGMCDFIRDCDRGTRFVVEHDPKFLNMRGQPLRAVQDLLAPFGVERDGLVGADHVYLKR